MQELLERKRGFTRKVLIVDDELIEREILGYMLQDKYEIKYADNGKKLLILSKRKKTPYHW